MLLALWSPCRLPVLHDGASERVPPESGIPTECLAPYQANATSLLLADANARLNVPFTGRKAARLR